jgi:transposase
MKAEIPSFGTLSEASYQAFISGLLSYIQSLEDDRFRDRQTIEEYRQLIWGKKSEKHISTLAALELDTNQPELPFTELPEIKATLTISTETVSAEKENKKYLRVVKPSGRKELSQSLPREYVEILPDNYHDGMVRIDCQVTQELDYRPGSFFVRVICRPRFSDPKTKSVVIAPMPQRPVHKAIAGAGLLAYILVSRFCDHLPYDRQVKMLNRHGEQIVNTSTVNRWVKESINLLSIIYSRIKQKVLESDYVQGDETTIKVLDRGKKSGKHQGYLWGYHAPKEKLVLMEYAQGRASEYPEVFLGDFRGVFQTDAYTGYDKLLRAKTGITHIGCWAHARRNFTKALESDHSRASAALDIIRQLYDVEAYCRKTGASPDQILRLRRERSLPVLEKLKLWVQQQEQVLNPKSLISVACQYMLKRWDKLCYYTSDGRILIDNNLLENRFRPVALGRKNWLFAGNHQSAERSGIIYSILQSCALHQIEPHAYISDVLTRLPNLLYAPKDKIDELLPGSWTPLPQKIYKAPVNRDSINVA